jgi:hypothetical protein
MLETSTPQRAPSAPTPARTVGVCAVVVAVLLALIALMVAFGQPPWLHSSVWVPLLFGACSATPFVIVGVALSREAPWAIGAVSTLAWITMLTSFAVTIGGFLMGILVLAGMGASFLPIFFALASVAESLHIVMSGGAYFLLTTAFALCIAILVTARGARKMLPPEAGHGLAAGRLLALGYAAIGIPAFVLTSRTQQKQRFAGEAKQEKNFEAFAVQTRQSLRRLQSCLYSYERAHTGEGFPAQLDAIGPGGTACVDSATLRPLVANARIGYSAPVDSTGHRGSFWILAAPSSKSSAFAYTYYADETGVVYDARMNTQYHPNGTYGIPPAPLTPAARSAYYYFSPVGSPTPDLGRLKRCFEQVYQEAGRLYPRRLQHSACWQYNWETRGDTLSFAVAGGTYKFVYHPRRAVNDSSYRAFDIDMQPNAYPVDGIRSYWMDDSGEIHWTRDDRPARRTDPLLGNCKSWQSCSD